jgi:hypothetical protein
VACHAGPRKAGGAWRSGLSRPTCPLVLGRPSLQSGPGAVACALHAGTGPTAHRPGQLPLALHTDPTWQTPEGSLPSQEERVGETPSVRPWRLGAGCGHESWSAQGSSATHSSKGTGVGGDVAQWLSGTTNTFLECVLPTEPRTGVLNIHVSRGQ